MVYTKLGIPHLCAIYIYIYLILYICQPSNYRLQESANFPRISQSQIHRFTEWIACCNGSRPAWACGALLRRRARCWERLAWTVEICFCPRSHWDVDMLVMLGMAGCWNTLSLKIWPVRVIYFYIDFLVSGAHVCRKATNAGCHYCAI